ncbi:MAG: alpha/beta hydrolase fold domain-containing protein [Flavobacteriales bacterium]
MKKFYSLTVLLLGAFTTVMAQCDGNRYRNYVFTDVVSTTDIQYGENIDYQGANTPLMMDIYEPAGDAATDRPLVIMCHGGYFLSGDKAAADMLPLCEDLARMGYVVASINYRVGIPFGVSLEEPYGQAVVRAVQDLRAAIRWFRKDAAESGNTYRIHPDKIFTGGASAGGFMALHIAYMDESEIPSWLDMSIAGLEGGLEGNSGNPGYSSDVQGIIPISGALGDSDWIDAGDTTPACVFHGDADQTVTIDSATFVLFGLINVTTIEGSNYCVERMNQEGIENCYHMTQGGGHVPYLGNPAVYDTTMSIMSNFLSHLVCDIPLDCEYRALSTSVDERDEVGLTIYPNPSHGSFQVLGLHEPTMVVVYDAMGRVVEQALLQPHQAMQLDIPAGMYLIRFGEDSGSKTYTLMVDEGY